MRVFSLAAAWFLLAHVYLQCVVCPLPAPSGDYVIVSYEMGDSKRATEAADAEGKAADARSNFTVRSVLYKDQVKHLKSAGLWPFAVEEVKEAPYDPFAGIDDGSEEEEEEEEG